MTRAQAPSCAPLRTGHGCPALPLWAPRSGGRSALAGPPKWPAPGPGTDRRHTARDAHDTLND